MLALEEPAARSLQFYCYAQKMITVVIETFARCFRKVRENF